MRVLYISYDGMTDPLGQSQVLPYLIGLSKMGHNFVLVSFEKGTRFESNRKMISDICAKNNIEWVPLHYTKKPPVLSTLWDVFKMNRKIKELHKMNRFDLVHCRSHIASIGGERLFKRMGVPFIFDMRGFYADERVDGNLWNLKNPLFKMVYNYFKKKEKQFLSSSMCSISLTEAGADIIRSWKGFENVPLKVIPCCADLDFFKADNVLFEKLDMWRNQLNILKSDFVLSYLGSIGTWYMADEMLIFFSRLLLFYPNAKFLFITPDSKDSILYIAEKNKVPYDAIRVIQAKRSEVPELLLLSKISLFFIKPLFSKKSSSPVKMGEILSMGIPVIANKGVGDVDTIIKNSECGILVEEFNVNSYDQAIKNIDNVLNYPIGVFLKAAETYYSLKKGVEAYNEVYRKRNGTNS